MSANPIDHPFGDRAAALMAEIADALFGGGEDWQTLERLQQALHPSPFRDAIKSIYTDKIDEQLKDAVEFNKIMDSAGYHTSYKIRPGGDTYTTNSASYSHTISPETFPKYPYGYGGNSSKT